MKGFDEVIASLGTRIPDASGSKDRRQSHAHSQMAYV
jgi:hypothetical protein